MNKNCLSYWYPKIQHVVPTPDTFWVKLSDGHNLIRILDGKNYSQMDNLCNMLLEAAELFGMPVFLRTGVFSGKHFYNRCCCLERLGDIGQHIIQLVEMSNCVSVMGLPHDAWVVRRMLTIKPMFHCERYGNMPVVREWRYFVENGHILYGIPYWPEDALLQGRPDRDDWLKCLPELHARPDSHVDNLAIEVGANIGDGTWSVDLMETEEGWYVIDMAIAEQSYGWDPQKV